MKKISSMFYLCFLLLIPFGLYAEDGSLWRDSEEIKTDLTESQWVMFLGMEIMRLNPITNFTLPQKSLAERTETLYGPALGFARKWYILGNLTTTTEPMFYFLQNNDITVEVPTNDEISSYQVSQFKEQYQYYGIRIAQTLGYTFEFNSFNVEPFVQVYIGQGFNRAHIHYHWDTRLSSEHQSFDSTVNESILNQGVSVGLQVIGLNGYMSFVKVTKNTLTFKKRETKTYRSVAGTSTYEESTEDLNSDLEKFSFTVGLGYIF